MNISNFDFKFSGHGHYKVTYTSNGGKIQINAIIDEMQIIDNTKNAESPKGSDIKELYNKIKRQQ